jgi:hypothetical protein
MAARPETDPSAKRSSPSTKKDELEQYGVWVKAEPEDISGDDDLEMGLDDFSLPEDGDSLPEDSFLSEEEEKLLGSFDDIEESPSGASSAVKVPDLEDDFMSLPDMEDFEPGEDAPTGARKKAAEVASAVEESEDFDFTMDDLDSGLSAPDINPSSELDLSQVEGLAEGTPEPFEPDELPQLEDFSMDIEEDLAKTGAVENAGTGSKAPELEDVSSDFLDMDSTAPSRKSASDLTHDVSDEFMDDEEEPVIGEPASTDDDAGFDANDIDLQFDDTIQAPEFEDSSDPGSAETTGFDNFLDTSDAEAAGFDDMAALEKDLSTPSKPQAPRRAAASAPVAVAPAQAETSLANELLLKIANELSSIRSELVALKSQLVSVRPEAYPAPLPAAPESAPVIPLPIPVPEPLTPTVGGFFDDEDDEKITLTGDELDNMLSSAAFTEESPGESVAPPSDEIDFLAAAGLAPDSSLPDEPLLPESGDYSEVSSKVAAEAMDEPVARISLEDEPLVPESSLDQAAAPDESEFLSQLADEGVAPSTQAPDDTSYLEEPIADDSIFDDTDDSGFAEVSLVEPDFSELALEADLGEDDLSGDLPLDEDDVAGLPDITLEMPPNVPSFESGTFDLGPSAEAVEEIDDEDFGEIALLDGETADKAGLVADPLDAEFEDLESDLSPEDSLHHEIRSDGHLAKESSKGRPDRSEDEVVSPDLSDDMPSALDDSLFVDSPDADGNEDISFSSMPGSEGSFEVADSLENEIDLDEGLDEEEIVPASKHLSSVDDASAPSGSLMAAAAAKPVDASDKLKSDIRSVLSYLDALLDSLPEEKIEEFAHSQHFDTYKRLFEELGLV